LERLKGAAQTVIAAGEAVIIKTPTGGGYGTLASKGRRSR
jgi:5-oxoprolinase (ATP-hydrolysing)